MNLRNYARGKQCQIRIPEYCSHDETTVVLCHIRLAGITGGGQKSPDILGAHGCHKCHGIADGAHSCKFSKDEIRLMFYEGVFRTQYLLIKEGILD